MGKAFVAKLAKEGARDPQALAAWIGRKKHGSAAFGNLAAAGRKKSDSAKGSAGPAKPSAAQVHAEATPKKPAALAKPLTQKEEVRVDSAASGLAGLSADKFAAIERKHGDPSQATTRDEILRAEAVRRARPQREQRERERSNARDTLSQMDPGLSGDALRQHLRRIPVADLRRAYVASAVLGFNAGEFAAVAGVELNSRRTRGHA